VKPIEYSRSAALYELFIEALCEAEDAGAAFRKNELAASGAFYRYHERHVQGGVLEDELNKRGITIQYDWAQK
jgi:hypothetical protein